MTIFYLIQGLLTGPNGSTTGIGHGFIFILTYWAICGLCASGLIRHDWDAEKRVDRATMAFFLMAVLTFLSGLGLGALFYALKVPIYISGAEILDWWFVFGLVMAIVDAVPFGIAVAVVVYIRSGA